MRDWDIHFMQAAHLNAAMSTCRKRKVGAVAHVNNHQLAAGFNGNLPGERHCDEGGCERCADNTIASGEDLMRCVCVHAEANLVAWCAKKGIVLEGASVSVTTYPCVDCIKLLASAGVVEVVYDQPYAESEWFPIHYAMKMRQLARP